jgi:hypothetical protein
MDRSYEEAAGSNLISALAVGQGWLTDEAKLNRLIELRVGPNQRLQAEQYLQAWQARPLRIQFIALAKGLFRIAQYEPKSRQAAIEKLNQFPRGTSFLWAGDLKDNKEEQAFEELSKAVASHGINVVRPQ